MSSEVELGCELTASVAAGKCAIRNKGIAHERAG